MQLSELTEKNIHSGKAKRGVCTGIVISLKSRAVKHLLCATSPQENPKNTSSFHAENSDFAVGIQAVESVSNDEIHLSRLRMTMPKNQGKLFIGKPIYSDEGVFLGNLADVHLQNFIVTEIKTDKNTYHSALTIAACSDALILRKEQPFPIGQRVHAPSIFPFLTENDVVTTRQILLKAAQNGSLIHLTLSLSPFALDIATNIKKHRFF